MSASAIFVGPNGQDPRIAIRAELRNLKTVTVGDLLYVGQVFRSAIRKRTFQGVDANGAPFSPYSTRGPYYFYPNRDSAGGNRKAMATAAANRHKKTGGLGVRTPFGIRYASYAAAKAAHGSSAVTLFGMEQHTHMLDTMLVKAGGSELDSSMEGIDFGSDMAAFEGNQACTELTLGFYGPEAERAKGHNEGTKTLPKREFFALSQPDLRMAERAIAERIAIRARAGVGPASGSNIGERSSGPVTIDDVGF